MKQCNNLFFKSIFMLLLTITCSCSTKKNIVKAIEIDAAKQKIIHKGIDNNEIKANCKQISEGNSVDILVSNYNPPAKQLL